MQVKHLRIERFRGIRELDWSVGGGFICLIGPGDSTKSTILDAIDFALSSRWKIDFDDSDFFNGDTSQEILITITVGALPDAFLADDKYGLDLRGWNSSIGLRDEPEDGDERVLSIRLRVDASLEPKWFILNDRRPEGRPISSQDRESMGVARIGEFLDRHLTWARGTALSRITSKGDDLASVLAQASRAARQTLNPNSLPVLQAAADRIKVLGQAVGVVPREKYQPHMDIQAIDVHAGGLTLHDGNIPIRRAGLGTRRLLTLALQRDAMSKGGIALIDEVEHGLEPHRLRLLLRTLRTEYSQSQSSNAACGQLIMSTHSSIVVDGLNVDQFRIVRTNNGLIQVLPIPAEFHKMVQKFPEAFLGSSIIVCEGDTEIGFCRALDARWSADELYNPFAVRGIVPIDGEGSRNSPRCAKCLAAIGYRVVYFGDSDCPLNPNAADMEQAGIKTILWSDSIAIEERVASDLPWAGLLEVLALAVEMHGENKIRAAVISKHGASPDLLAAPSHWTETTPLRTAIGAAAKAGDWFKTLDRGERLGNIVVRLLPDVPQSDLATKLSDLKQWVDSHG